MIRDQIVFGVKNKKLREKLINEGENLTLDKAIQISKNFEYCRQQMSLINQKDVHLISSRDKGHLRGGRRGRERDRYPAQREFSKKPIKTNYRIEKHSKQPLIVEMNGIDGASAAATRRTKNGHNAPHGERHATGVTRKTIGDECVNQNTFTMSMIMTVTVKIHRTIIRVIRGYNPSPKIR
ncbi:hypothetical protein DPMN_059627 [Dreissena polymorpha]|uniref:Uncharacterized protein n=1 Tax=Dreissena polymorpha TaxID=45954 RepID=A0A9D4C4J3_DREPO|nr:hypothetical protein DPMN_059627 [Dreissena polymorpha]